jgi:hypothetical protein
MAAAAAAAAPSLVSDIPPPPIALDLQVSWLAPRVSNTPPSERRGHTAVNLDNQWILVYGGGGAAGLCGDLFALKIDMGTIRFERDLCGVWTVFAHLCCFFVTETPSWVRVDDASGIKPPPLTGHSAVIAFHRTPGVRFFI